MRARQVLAVRPLLLVEVGHRVEPEAVEPEIEPEAQHLDHLVLHCRVLVVQVRLVAEEAVPVVLAADGVVRPVRDLGVDEDDPGVAVGLVGVRPDVVVAVGPVRVLARGLEPGMVGRGVVHDQVDDHAHPALVRRLDEGAEVLDRAVVGVDPVEVCDVVAAVAEGRRIERQHPDAVDPEPLQVVELLLQAAEVAGAVVVAVEERARVDLVEDGRLEPVRVGLEPVDRLLVPLDVAHAAPIFITCAPPGGEANVVAPDSPAVALAGEQVANGELLGQPEVRRHDDHVLTRRRRIEVRGDRDVGRLEVGEDMLAMGVEQVQVRRSAAVPARRGGSRSAA